MCSESGRLRFPSGSLCQLGKDVLHAMKRKDVLDAEKGCAGWVSCGDGPTEAATASAPSILAGISLTQSLILKDADLPYYPRRWGLKSSTGDYFLLILSQLVVTWITLILQGEGSRAAPRQTRCPGLAGLWCHPFPAGCSPGGKCLWQMTQAIGNFQKQAVLC